MSDYSSCIILTNQTPDEPTTITGEIEMRIQIGLYHKCYLSKQMYVSW